MAFGDFKLRADLSRATPAGDPPLEFDVRPAVLAPPAPALEAVVVIPARNEADLLPLALAALVDQVDEAGRPLDRRLAEILVLANNCTDATAEVARRFARDHPNSPPVLVVEAHLPPDRAHVGTARRWLMDRAADRFVAVDRPGGLILSTDADTVVAADWLAAHRAEVAAGAEAVAGLVEVDRLELARLDPRLRRAYWRDRVYRERVLQLEARLDPNPLDPPPRHDFHGGASLAITARLYRALGGLPPLRSLEDVALAEALWRADARFVHSPRVRVRTSLRTASRADGGFGRELATRVESPASPVRAGAAIERELRDRAALRHLFVARQGAGPAWRPEATPLLRLSERLGMTREALASILAGEPTFGRWLEAIRGFGPARPPDDGALVSIRQANRDLRERVRAVRSEAPGRP